MKNLLLTLIVVVALAPTLVFAQPPRYSGDRGRSQESKQFAPPQHAPGGRYNVPTPAPRVSAQVYAPQRSYDRTYDYARRSAYDRDYGHNHHQHHGAYAPPTVQYYPNYLVRPSVIVVPTVVEPCRHNNYNAWGAGTPYIYGTRGFSFSVGGNGTAVSITSVR